MLRGDSITSLMLKHHQVIDKLLFDFEKKIDISFPELEVIFEKFKMKINEHFSIEEASIFPIANKKDEFESLRLKNLLREHKDLKEIIKIIDEEIKSGRKPDTFLLRDLLSAHEQREVEGFYPLLDSRLPESEKSRIINYVNSRNFL
jgi:hemerythrin-like domain-containing protein